jgi:hypothetical protein
MLWLMIQSHYCANQCPSLNRVIKFLSSCFGTGNAIPTLQFTFLRQGTRQNPALPRLNGILDTRSFDVMCEVMYEVYQIEFDQSDRRCGLRHSELGLPGMWRKNGGPRERVQVPG